MPIWLQTLRSGSSGNAVLVGEGHQALLIDCGITAQRTMSALLDVHAAPPVTVVASVITHNHGDHCHPATLKVLQDREIPVYAGPQVYRHVRGQMKFRERPLSVHQVVAGEGVGIGPLQVQAAEVAHSPNTQTMAYRFVAGDGSSVVYATDLCDDRPIRRWLAECDVVVLECNHCPRLLDLHPNYASRFHLSNPHAGMALVEARRARAAPWQAVVLAHLSEKRNTPELAAAAVRGKFAEAGLAVDFPLTVAPRYAAGERVTASCTTEGVASSVATPRQLCFEFDASR